MPVTIGSALYVKDGEVREITLSEVDAGTYDLQYKGYLYCTTPGCDARLVFVYGTERPSYFRTWKNDNHIEDCIYKFDRVSGRAGVNTEYTINVAISSERKKNALKEAYKLARMTAEELERRRSKRTQKRQNKTTIGKGNRIAINPVINNSDDEEVITEGKKGPKLLKRNVDSLKDSDEGKARVLIGIIQDIKYDDSRALIRVGRNKKVVDVKFEEAFVANSPNHLGLFHYIEKLLSERGDVIFTGVGEVRKAINGDNFEFIVFHGDEFNIEGMSLLSLAAHYARGSLRP
jgi:hypothetical protein